MRQAQLQCSLESRVADQRKQVNRSCRLHHEPLELERPQLTSCQRPNVKPTFRLTPADRNLIASYSPTLASFGSVMPA